MQSFRNKVDQRRQIFLNLAGSIESQLRDAYAKRHEEEQETQTSVAEKLGVNRSAVNHRLSGRTNMRIKTIADMVWALGHCVEVNIYDPADRPEQNSALAPTPSITADDMQEPTTASTTEGNHIIVPIPVDLDDGSNTATN